MTPDYTREIPFASIQNFRDLGGYQTAHGQTVAWRRLFRSGNLADMTAGDFARFHHELGIRVVIDLRSRFEIDRQGLGLVSHPDIIHRNVSFVSDGGKKETNDRQFQGIKHMGELYLNMVRSSGFGTKLVEALQVITASDGAPLVFHCFAGKDRTSILAAAVLGTLEVSEIDIAADYALSNPFMAALRHRINEDKNDPNANTLPEFFWDTSAGLMQFFLDGIRKEYGSMKDYLQANGADKPLFAKLEKQLLV